MIMMETMDPVVGSITPESSSSRLTHTASEGMSTIRENDMQSVGTIDLLSRLPKIAKVTKSKESENDNDDDDNDLIVTSSTDEGSNRVGLFDAVKREFRCKTAVIANIPAYEDPHHPAMRRKRRVNFIQVI